MSSAIITCRFGCDAGGGGAEDDPVHGGVISPYGVSGIHARRVIRVGHAGQPATLSQFLTGSSFIRGVYGGRGPSSAGKVSQQNLSW